MTTPNTNLRTFVISDNDKDYIGKSHYLLSDNTQFADDVINSEELKQAAISQAVNKALVQFKLLVSNDNGLDIDEKNYIFKKFIFPEQDGGHSDFVEFLKSHYSKEAGNTVNKLKNKHIAYFSADNLGTDFYKAKVLAIVETIKIEKFTEEYIKALDKGDEDSVTLNSLSEDGFKSDLIENVKKRYDAKPELFYGYLAKGRLGNENNRVTSEDTQKIVNSILNDMLVEKYFDSHVESLSTADGKIADERRDDIIKQIKSDNEFYSPLDTSELRPFGKLIDNKIKKAVSDRVELELFAYKETTKILKEEAEAAGLTFNDETGVATLPNGNSVSVDDVKEKGGLYGSASTFSNINLRRNGGENVAHVNFLFTKQQYIREQITKVASKNGLNLRELRIKKELLAKIESQDVYKNLNETEKTDAVNRVYNSNHFTVSIRTSLRNGVGALSESNSITNGITRELRDVRKMEYVKNYIKELYNRDNSLEDFEVEALTQAVLSSKRFNADFYITSLKNEDKETKSHVERVSGKIIGIKAEINSLITDRLLSKALAVYAAENSDLGEDEYNKGKSLVRKKLVDDIYKRAYIKGSDYNFIDSCFATRFFGHEKSLSIFTAVGMKHATFKNNRKNEISKNAIPYVELDLDKRILVERNKAADKWIINAVEAKFNETSHGASSAVLSTLYNSQSPSAASSTQPQSLVGSDVDSDVDSDQRVSFSMS